MRRVVGGLLRVAAAILVDEVRRQGVPLRGQEAHLAQAPGRLDRLGGGHVPGAGEVVLQADTGVDGRHVEAAPRQERPRFLRQRPAVIAVEVAPRCVVDGQEQSLERRVSVRRRDEPQPVAPDQLTAAALHHMPDGARLALQHWPVPAEHPPVEVKDGIEGVTRAVDGQQRQFGILDAPPRPEEPGVEMVAVAVGDHQHLQGGQAQAELPGAVDHVRAAVDQQVIVDQHRRRIAAIPAAEPPGGLTRRALAERVRDARTAPRSQDRDIHWLASCFRASHRAGQPQGWRRAWMVTW